MLRGQLLQRCCATLRGELLRDECHAMGSASVKAGAALPRSSLGSTNFDESRRISTNLDGLRGISANLEWRGGLRRSAGFAEAARARELDQGAGRDVELQQARGNSGHCLGQRDGREIGGELVGRARLSLVRGDGKAGMVQDSWHVWLVWEVRVDPEQSIVRWRSAVAPGCSSTQTTYLHPWNDSASLSWHATSATEHPALELFQGFLENHLIYEALSA